MTTLVIIVNFANKLILVLTTMLLATSSYADEPRFLAPYQSLDEAPRSPFNANASLSYGIESANIYSPLANKHYYELMAPLGGVDDSFGTIPPDPKKLIEARNLLKSISIEYIAVPSNKKTLEIRSELEKGYKDFTFMFFVTRTQKGEETFMYELFKV